MLLYPFYGTWGKRTFTNNSISNEENLLLDIEKAKSEWEYALKRFNDVSEPDMVDYITYYIIAAERRYMYLLNKYKKFQKKEIKLNAKEFSKEKEKEME